MARTRLIRPAFFKDADLYDAEVSSGLPLRVAFAGLWTVADKPDGRFAWKPREIKTDVMPHDPVDFSAVLDALHVHGFIARYVIEGKHYGWIPGFKTYQTFHKSEAASPHPAPDSPGALPVTPRNSGECREDVIAVTGAITGTNYSAAVPPEQDEKAELWGLIRKCLYAPDGLPPSDWDESRDGSILKALRKQHSTNDIAAAIQGVAVIRDHPGRYADIVTWLTPNTKATLRVLYNTSSGVLPLFSIATQAYWKKANTRTDKEKSRPAHIGSILGGAA